MSIKIYGTKGDMSCNSNASGENRRSAKIIIGSINCINNICKDYRELKFICLDMPPQLVYSRQNTVFLGPQDISGSYKYSIVTYYNEILAQGEIKYNELFDGMRINPEGIKAMSSSPVYSEAEIKSMVPLFYISYNERTLADANSSHGIMEIASLDLYSQLRYSEKDIIFISTGHDENTYIIDKNNTSDIEGLCNAKVEEIKPSVILDKCIRLHSENAVFLGNHQCYYRKEKSEFEVEYKFNLANVDIWELILDVYTEIKEGKLNNYILEYKDEFQKWDYMNYLHEITAPEEDRGYISFIPLTNNKYLIKRKYYTEDQLERKEEHIRNVSIPGTIDEYLKNNYKFEYRTFPPFRRVRYDINLESLKTGNVFGIFFDHISLEDNDNIMMQCELEYLRTRSLFSNDEYLKELDEVLDWTKDFFKRKQVQYIETFCSKLSFLRNTFK